MQREIKFRTWSNPEQTFIDPKFVTFCTMRIETGLLLIKSTRDYIFQQFTGLTDRNGVDIYEGDIIDTVQRGVEVVEFDQEYDMIGYHACWEKGKIIGNIHQQINELEKIKINIRPSSPDFRKGYTAFQDFILGWIQTNPGKQLSDLQKLIGTSKKLSTLS